MDHRDIVQLAGNLADWLTFVQGMSPQEIGAVGEALRLHAACLERKDDLLPNRLEDAFLLEDVSESIGNPLNN